MAPAQRGVSLPAWYLRHPSELELVRDFLAPRVRSGRLPEGCRFIHEADVYSADPKDLTSRFDAVRADDGEEVWYFLSPTRTKSPNGQRRARTVENGAGCWHSEAGLKAVVDAGSNQVGYRQFFSFVKKEDEKRIRTGWLMVELGVEQNTSSPTVLCKIYFTPRTPNAASPRGSLPAVAQAAGAKRKAAVDENPAPAPVQRRRPDAAAAKTAAPGVAPDVTLRLSTSTVVIDDEEEEDAERETVAPPCSPVAAQTLQQLQHIFTSFDQRLQPPYFLLPSTTLHLGRLELYVLCRGGCRETHKFEMGDSLASFKVCRGDCQATDAAHA